MKFFPHIHRIILLSFVFGLFLSCKTKKNEENELVIAISKERKTEGKLYGEWLAHQHIAFRSIDLSLIETDAIVDSLAKCHALLLTGGADIYPGLYGKENDTARCGEFDHQRDKFEAIAFETAEKMGLPILGICRGMQFINISMGGTLWIDLPSDIGSGDLHRTGEEGWSDHEVVVMPETVLASLADATEYTVASNHHQGIEKLAPGLKAAAMSQDMLIEAVERSEKTDESYLLAVQWHPEWMDRNDLLSGKIAKSFLEAAKKYKAEKKNQ
jgi:putative glutamine amidotransferase